MKWICIFAFPAALVGCAYVSLRFFSRLVEVDMVAAMRWGFGARRFELVLTWCMFYLMVFVMVFAMMTKPWHTLSMNVSHIGGLLGYAESDDTMRLYDPIHREYESYMAAPPPPAASRFDETFEVVALYRPLFTRYYQNVHIQGYFASIVMMFIALLGLTLMYLAMYWLAGEYIKASRLDQRVTHLMISENFQMTTGFKVPHVLTGLILTFALFTYISASMAGRIVSGYERQFSSFQKELKSGIVAKVVPESVLKGRVVSRIKGYRKRYAHSGSTTQRDRTIPTSTFTFEFEGFAHYPPVYISIEYDGDAGTNDNVRLLDELFASKKDTVPREGRDLDFKVNEDYSISLVK